MSNFGTLTRRDVNYLSQVINGVQRGDRIRIILDKEDMIVLEGVLRSIGNDHGGRDDVTDIRDQFVRITALTGMEHFMPMSEVANNVAMGMAAIG